MVLMGIFNVTIAVANVNGDVFEEIETTVDTACDYTTVPREMLQRLGVPVTGEAISEMADGRQVPSDIGWARVRLEGLEVYTPVIFAEEGEASLLGVTTLEVSRLGVDPTNQRLIPVNLRRY